jgi:aryl-alcohol dehydrogenase-like predicted oxidoreductase
MKRRDFLKTTIAAGVTCSSASIPLPAQTAVKRSATDWVKLGNSGVEVTRLALGTGTFGGRVQREMSQEDFTRLVRHAYDRGIRFFETADSYTGMPQRLSIALKGIPRDSYKLMTKMRWRDQNAPKETIDRFRKDLNSDYFDILLIHCVRQPRWPQELERMRDAFSEAKQRKIILAHGASVHGLLPLRDFPGNKWLDVALLRVNHNGTRMDTLGPENVDAISPVNEVTRHLSLIHGQGTGVLGMKLIGEGRFTTPELREQAMQFVMKLGTVDAVTIGYKNTAEVDEAIERMNRALNT